MTSMMAVAHATVSYGPTGTDPSQSYGPVDNGIVDTIHPTGGYAPVCDPYTPGNDCYDPCVVGGVDCLAPKEGPWCDSDDDEDDCALPPPCDPNNGPCPVEPCPPGFISIGGPDCIPDPSIDTYVPDVQLPVIDHPCDWNEFTDPSWTYVPTCDKKYGVDKYVESYQKDCGILLIDIVKYICDYWFKDVVDPTIYDDLTQHLGTVYDVTTNVANTQPDITAVIDSFTTVTDFCHQTPDISPDHDLYGIIKLCAEACVNMYKSPVTKDVYDAWVGVKDTCVNNNSWSELEDLLYALAYWLKDDGSAFDHIKTLMDSTVPGLNQDVRNLYDNINFTLQSVDDDNMPAVDSNSASTLMVSVGAVATAVLAVIL